MSRATILSPEEYVAIAKLIRFAIRSLDLRQTDLADEADSDPHHINDALHGKRPGLLLRLAVAVADRL